MSTSIGQPNFAPSWKQEVSRRIAAHQDRGGTITAKPVAPAQSRHGAASRAAQAAARVAARYAHAPTYQQMQAAEAPAAQPAVHAALPRLQAVSAGPRPWEPELPKAAAPMQMRTPDREATVMPVLLFAPSSLEAWESEYSRFAGKPDFALLPSTPARARATQPVEDFAPSAEDSADGAEDPASSTEEGWDRPALAERASSADDGLEPVEPDLPIPANLIEFPRELVAVRKRRPHRAEGPFAAEGMKRQLSIFEVDPEALSIEPELPGAAPVWPSPEWSSVELEVQPLEEPEPEDELASLHLLQLAPAARRLTAALVDGALIAGALMGAALVSAAKIGHPLPARIVELSAVSALLLAGLLYQALFLTLAEATPGMRCVRISLCTFDGQIPTRAQLRGRLGALLLSILPVGLGVAWMLFDDDHLCWHDRLSKTYLRTD